MRSARRPQLAAGPASSLAGARRWWPPVEATRLRLAGLGSVAAEARPLTGAAVTAAAAAAHPPPPLRTHLCGELRAAHAGAPVRVCGWVQHVRRLGATIVFLTLRDAYGVVQVTLACDGEGEGAAGAPVPVAPPELVALAGSLRLETVVCVVGTVRLRPAALANGAMPTGDVEVAASALSVLGAVSENLPFTIGPATGALAAIPEDTRLAHRPLDLRRPLLQRNLRVRSAVTHAIRSYLHGGCAPPFVEVETPALFRSTPEGAREFLVPARGLPAGRAYALTQSPQQHKQMLMVGGLDRYFQIARCFRDEAGRADRQPEFTQVDLELAFARADDVMAACEGIVAAAFAAASALSHARAGGGSASSSLAHVSHARAHVAPDIAPPLPAWAPLSLPLPRVTYTHALCVYGSDKPDRRWGMRIGDVTRVLLLQPTAAVEVEAGGGGTAGVARWWQPEPPVGSPGEPLHRVLERASTTGAPSHTRVPERAAEAQGGGNGGSAAVASDSSPPPPACWHPLEWDADLSPLLPTAVGVKAFVARGLGAALSRKEWDALGGVGSDVAERRWGTAGGAGGLFRVRVEADLSWRGSPVVKAVPPHAQQAVSAALGATGGDVVVLGCGPALAVCKALGAARLALAALCRRKALQQQQPPLPPSPDEPGAPSLATVDLFWVTDFPLFELADEALEGHASWRDGTGDGDGATLPQLQSVHHPFTAPREGRDAALLHAALQSSAPAAAQAAAAAALPAGAAPPAPASRPQLDGVAWRRLLGVRGQHYDLVCNGVELGGGSVRMHDAATQRGVLEAVLRVTPQQLEGFAPLLAALGSGAPPHGGLALGLDRLVALLVGPECAQSVRDVIAFPKSAAGNDALTGAPAEATPAQWAELHLAPVVAAARALD